MKSRKGFTPVRGKKRNGGGQVRLLHPFVDGRVLDLVRRYPLFMDDSLHRFNVGGKTGSVEMEIDFLINYD
jgi:hypothetical protein